MKKQTTCVQKPSYRKAWMSAGIFLTILVVGGLAIFAASNLDDLKAGANKNTLTATSWDALIEHVKNHDIIIGEGLSKLDTDILRVENKVDALGGFGSLNSLDTKLTTLSTQINQMSIQNNGGFFQILSGLTNFSLWASGIKSQLSGIDIKLTGLSGIVVNKLNGLSGLMVDKISGLSGVMMNNFTTLKDDTSILKSNISTLTTNISRVEGTINLLSGDYTDLQEIQKILSSLKQEIRTMKQRITVGTGDDNGIVVVAGSGKVVACQNNSSNYNPYCTTKTVNGVTPDSNMYGDNGIVVVAGSGNVVACQNNSNYNPYCTTVTF